MKCGICISSIWLLSTALFSTRYAFSSEPLKFVWNAYCPYTCQVAKTGQPGYAMELVQSVFDNSKYKIEYTYVLSWNRAMQQVEKGEKDAIVFSYHNAKNAHKYVIPTQSLAINDNTSFAILKSNPWKFTSVESLDLLNHIGAYKGTVWSNKQISDFEMKQQHKFIYLHGDNIAERAFSMLRRGRLDAWEDSNTLLDYYVYSKKVNNIRIESIDNPQISTGDLLFSAKNSRSAEYAAFFSHRLQQIRKSGQLELILQKYGLQDWKKTN
jgi:polar amino acid transport system substrate-binding protein